MKRVVIHHKLRLAEERRNSSEKYMETLASSEKQIHKETWCQKIENIFAHFSPF
jgi:hypothetical protein